jgi:PAS domain S-box-containing protein
MADLMPDVVTRASRTVILHIEDDPAGRYAISRILQREGFTVREAATGSDGLRLVREGSDLVILDVNLPDMNGFEVCQRIKADPSTATIPVLHLSASYVTDEARVTGLEGGADSYLVQPVSPDVLVATVRALLRMRRAEERYRRIFLNAVEGIFQATIDGELTAVNPALARMLGYVRPEVMITVPGVARQLYADPGSHAEFVGLMQEHGSVSGFETQGRRKDGSALWVSINARALYDNGEVVGYEGTVQDVTERNEAEKEVRRLNERLEQRVHQRTVQLEEANRELESLSYSVSHNLRAPLRHIDGFAHLLRDRLELSDETERHYLETIVQSARYGGELIDDLLSFLRMGRVELRHTVVDMNGLLLETLGDLKYEARERAIDWKLGELPAVSGDRLMLKHVWQNLLGNAVKYTRTRERAVIEVGVTEELGEAAFFVRDNGVGFDMQYADKLFGVFQRLHRPEEFEGTGMGLASVRRIVLRHGGRVWAEGRTGEGATFYFSLP